MASLVSLTPEKPLDSHFSVVPKLSRRLAPGCRERIRAKTGPARRLTHQKCVGIRQTLGSSPALGSTLFWSSVELLHLPNHPAHPSMLGVNPLDAASLVRHSWLTVSFWISVLT